jgi:hypothetical protein
MQWLLPAQRQAPGRYKTMIEWDRLKVNKSPDAPSGTM